MIKMKYLLKYFDENKKCHKIIGNSRPHVFMATRSQLMITDHEIDTFLIKIRPYLLELSDFYARILGLRLSKFAT